MSDLRLSERIPFRTKVKYGLCDHCLEGYSFNLSEDGICIRAQRVFPSLYKILIKIPISRTNPEESSMDESIRLGGTVAWVSPAFNGILSTMGIKFSSRSNDMKRIYLHRRIGRL
jgi:PilZ domain-containing protein